MERKIQLPPISADDFNWLLRCLVTAENGLDYRFFNKERKQTRDLIEHFRTNQTMMREHSLGINKIVTAENLVKFCDEWTRIVLTDDVSKEDKLTAYIALRLRQELKADIEKTFWNDKTAQDMILNGDGN